MHKKCGKLYEQFAVFFLIFLLCAFFLIFLLCAYCK